jgi:hypothetical protein
VKAKQSFYVVFAAIAAVVIPATIALRTVIHPGVLQVTSENPTPAGYTWSLLLFIIPILALGWWFACRPDLQFPRKAFWRTIAVLAPIGFVLDLLFGNAFHYIAAHILGRIDWLPSTVCICRRCRRFNFYLRP